MQSKIKSVRLSDIAIDGETQQRERIDNAIVSEYAEAMRCGAKFPPVTLFFDGAAYWLADGFHRRHAYAEAEIPEVPADVRDGTKRDARLFSASANGTHGIRLTNADKRRSVMVLLGDKEWCQWSDNQIAKHCHVTQPFVSKVRKEVIPDKSEGVITVIPPTTEKPKAVPTVGTGEAENNQEKPQEQDDNHYDPNEEALDIAHQTVRELAAENEALKDRLAVEVMPGCEDDKTAALKTITELRARVTALEAELDAVKSSRDGYMRENASMKSQMAMQRKEIQKLKGGQ